MKHKESKMPNPGYGFGPQSVNLFHYNILNTKLLVNAAYSCQFDEIHLEFWWLWF
jgi:hypothetical protein